MRASETEFRFRALIVMGLVGLGFWAPWVERLGIGRRTSLLRWLVVEVSRNAHIPQGTATVVVLVFAALIAAMGALLRVSGTAWISAGVMRDTEMQARALATGGPYRFVRNPLYLGAWFMVAGMAFLMPVSGAIFALATVIPFQVRLIFSEEDFLMRKLGEPYRVYLRTVPRLLPRLRTGLKPAQQRPDWLHAVIAEIFAISVFLILAFLSWDLDDALMRWSLLVCLVVSMIARTLIPKEE